jgi:integrase
MKTKIEGAKLGATGKRRGTHGLQEPITHLTATTAAILPRKGNLEAAGRSATRKPRRTRTEHPGVYLKARKLKGGISWRARFTNPDTGKTVFETLDRITLTTYESRRQWAIKKSKSLGRRRADLATGAPVRTYTLIDQAVESYLEACRNKCRPATTETYARDLALFLEWAGDGGIGTVEELSPTKLALLKMWLIARRQRASAAKGKRGAKLSTSKKLSPFSTNRVLRSIRVALGHWRRIGQLPLVSPEAATDALKAVPGALEPPIYLYSSDCRKLLQAALRHDSAKFEVTREEHAGLSPAGSTAKYPSISPFILCAMLTGMRAGELLSLKWNAVDLEAFDNQGEKVGEIRLSAEDTKTKHARVIGLEVAPSLRSLLTALKLKAGKNEYVFGGVTPLSRFAVESARKRLKNYGAPKFSWQTLRQTCGTYLTNSPGIFGAASAFLSAKQLGHGVAVAEKYYIGLIRGIPREAKTLEQAMQIEDLARKVVEAAGQARRASGKGGHTAFSGT